MRSILTIIILLLLGAFGIWLYENPGAAQIIWLGYEVSSGMGVFTGFILLLGLAAAFLFWLLGSILSLPGMLWRRYRRRKHARGLSELEAAIISLASENRQIRKRAERAAELLEGGELSSLGHLLEADAARLSDDDKMARHHYESLTSDNKTAFVGYRGLALVERQAGNIKHAIEYALEAHKRDGDSAWASRVLAELYEENHDYQKAIEVLDKAVSHNARAKASVAKHTTELYIKLAEQRHAEGNIKAALANAELAFRKDKDDARLPLLLASLYAADGDFLKAEKTITPLFETENIQAALQTYGDILQTQYPNHAKDSELSRLSEAEKSLTKHKSNMAVAHFLAELSLQAQIWGKARSYMDGVPKDKHNAAHCLLMARLEQSEAGNMAAAQMWLERAESSENLS